MRAVPDVSGLRTIEKRGSDIFRLSCTRLVVEAKHTFLQARPLASSKQDWFATSSMDTAASTIPGCTGQGSISSRHLLAGPSYKVRV